MTKPRVVFVTSLLSPFQVDVADAVNREGAVEYHVCFTEYFQRERGKHWLVDLGSRAYIHCADVRHRPVEWTRKVLDEVTPQVCLCGFYRGAVAEELIRRARSGRFALGLWGEQLHPASPPKSWVKEGLLRLAFRSFDFSFAIGDRAYQQYAGASSASRTHLVPYGEDLGSHLAIERGPATRPMKFLFSGRLVEQHNIAGLCAALAAVVRRRSDELSFTVAARGPEERHLSRAIRKTPALARAVRYDRDYQAWNDRIRPFAACDVLLYPSHHAGWGLVVPEAMAAGMLVIASPGVESARYLITPGVDGLMIGTRASDIERAIEWCLDHPQRVREMGHRARAASSRGSAEHVARCVSEILPSYVHSEKQKT